MTTKQKCDKLAKVLDTVSSKLREDIGMEVWEQDEVLMQSLVTKVHLFLKKAMELSSDELPQSAKLKKKTKGKNTSIDKESDLLNDWPDILS